MSASLLRSSLYAITIAAGLASPVALHAGTVAPVAKTTITGQGSSVSVSNMNVPAEKSIFLIVGAESANSSAGVATIYGRVGSTLKKVKTLKETTAPYSEFGKSVSMDLSGTIALVGAPNFGVPAGEYVGPGSAFLYRYKGKTWQKATALVGTEPVGFAHQGEAVFVSPDGKTAFVGGPNDNDKRGAVWVYDISKGSAVQKAKLVPNDAEGEYGSRFGVAISSSKDGSRLVIGGESDGGNGAVWIFEKKKGKWSQSGAKITVTGETGPRSAHMGTAVAMTWDGNTFAASAPMENQGQGAIYVYVRAKDGKWTMKQRLADSNPPTEYGMLGLALAVQPDNGATIVASEPYTLTSDPVPPPTEPGATPPVEWRGRVLTYVRADAASEYSQVSMITADPCNNLGRSLAISQSGDALFAGSPDTMTGTTPTGGTCFYMRPGGSNEWMFMGAPIVDK